MRTTKPHFLAATRTQDVPVCQCGTWAHKFLN